MQVAFVQVQGAGLAGVAQKAFAGLVDLLRFAAEGAFHPFGVGAFEHFGYRQNVQRSNVQAPGQRRFGQPA
ncbi:hypothetical protein D3C78_1890960 [compost metagenome]